jgi:hypothetical protein
MPIVAKVLKLICYIPEAFVVGLACLTFVGIRPVMKRMALFGVVYGCSIFLFRDLLLPWLGLPLGIHTVILFMINALLLGLFFGLNLPGSVICAFLYFLVLLIAEPLAAIPFKLAGVPMTDILASIWLSTLYNCLSLSLVLVVICPFKKKDFTLLPITKLIRDERDG